MMNLENSLVLARAMVLAESFVQRSEHMPVELISELDIWAIKQIIKYVALHTEEPAARDGGEDLDEEYPTRDELKEELERAAGRIYQLERRVSEGPNANAICYPPMDLASDTMTEHLNTARDDANTSKFERMFNIKREHDPDITNKDFFTAMNHAGTHPNIEEE